MADLVLWETCRVCTHFGLCREPFAASGICPHATQARRSVSVPLIYQPIDSGRYASLLQENVRVASLFHCWRRGKPPTNDNYLYLRSLVWEQQPQDERAYHFLADILNEVCAHWSGAVLTYYFGIPDTSPEFFTRSTHVTEIVASSVSMAIMASGGEMVDQYALLKPGADWTRLLMDQVRLATRDALGLKNLDFSHLNDEDFRLRFEAEWVFLLQFQDLFYGFRVIPRMGLDDFVRYSLLPHADRNIRGQISDYFVHQSSEYPQLGQLFGPNFVAAAFGKRLKQIYRPLIEKAARLVSKNSQIPASDVRARADIETQIWQVFEGATQKFRFYVPRKKARLCGKIGLLGLPQTPEQRSYFERRAKERGLFHNFEPLTLSDLTEVGFAHYIELKLQAWVTRNYPPEPRAREVVGNALIENASSPVPNGVESWLGHDGEHYAQRAAAAQFYGVTPDQLRNWDRDGSFPALRANQVLSAPLPEGVKSSHRLYALSNAAMGKVNDLKLRKATRSTQAKGKECTRKMASSMIGVPPTTLLHWETKGWVTPEKRGRSVIYRECDLARARALKQERKK